MKIAKIEICVDSFNSALNAEIGNADRIELCNNLYVGGTTPNYALIEQCQQLLNVSVNVLIRPRGGDFSYNKYELDQIKKDILMCRKLDVNGVVIGVLKQNGDVDFDFLKECIELAGDLEITFHRAFDVCSNPIETVRELDALGIDRLLTSGQQATALAGIKEIAEYNRICKSMIILAGSGVRAHNVEQVIRESGVQEVHATAFGEYKPNANYMNKAQMGHTSDSNSYRETDVDIVKELVLNAKK